MGEFVRVAMSTKPRRVASRKDKRQKVVSLAKQIHVIMRADSPMKYIDFFPFGTGLTTAGAIYGLGNIAAGTAANNRLGAKIRLDKLELRLYYQASLMGIIATADIYNNLRTILVRCIGPQSLITTSMFPNVVSHVDKRQEFKVLHDEIFYLKTVASGLAAAGSGYGSSPEGLWRNFTVKLGNDVLYDMASGTTDSYGVPLLYVVSDSTVTPNPIISCAARLWFRDVVV